MDVEVPNTYAFDLDFGASTPPATAPTPEDTVDPIVREEPTTAAKTWSLRNADGLMAMGTAGMAAVGIVALALSALILSVAAYKAWQSETMVIDTTAATSTTAATGTAATAVAPGTAVELRGASDEEVEEVEDPEGLEDITESEPPVVVPSSRPPALSTPESAQEEESDSIWGPIDGTTSTGAPIPPVDPPTTGKKKRRKGQ